MMREVLTRRFSGNIKVIIPDFLLIDGGSGHVSIMEKQKTPAFEWFCALRSKITRSPNLSYQLRYSKLSVRAHHQISSTKVVIKWITETFHRYLNPERDIPYHSFKIHGISEEFLEDKPLFSDEFDGTLFTGVAEEQKSKYQIRLSLGISLLTY